MKGIECALVGRLDKDAELRRSAAGREWMLLNVAVPEGDGEQFITVGSWSHSIHELAPFLTAGTDVYVEGKLKLRSWVGADGTTTRTYISVQASVVQPLALIGEKKPKRPRAAAKMKQTSAAVDAPLPFNDDITYIGT